MFLCSLGLGLRSESGKEQTPNQPLNIELDLKKYSMGLLRYIQPEELGAEKVNPFLGIRVSYLLRILPLISLTKYLLTEFLGFLLSPFVLLLPTFSF